MAQSFRAAALKLAVSKVSLGDSLKAADFGYKNFPNTLRIELALRGLALCCLTGKVRSAIDMYDRRYSFDGKQRYNMFNAARIRAEQKGLDFDPLYVEDILRGHLPTCFNQRDYEHAACNGWTYMSLSLDRIDSTKGYIQGNVRFLPFGLNRSLQAFSDEDALQIVERLLGWRAVFCTNQLGLELRSRILLILKRKRSNARVAGKIVEPCFTFENLQDAGLLVDRCSITGLCLQWASIGLKGPSLASPCFDRIDPQGPYSIENVQIISMAANMVKSNHTKDGLRRLHSDILHLQTPEFVDSGGLPRAVSSVDFDPVWGRNLRGSPAKVKGDRIEPLLLPTKEAS